MASSSLTLDEVASVAFFRSAPIGSFRRVLRQGFCDALQRSTAPSSPSAVPSDASCMNPTRYSRAAIFEEFSKLDWKDLCAHHDAAAMAETGNSLTAQVDAGDEEALSARSVLVEVVHAMVDPRVVPKACGGELITSLVTGMLQSPGRGCGHFGGATDAVPSGVLASRWTQSQKFLLDVMTGLLRTNPVLSFAVLDYVRTFPLSSPNQANRLLSTIYSVAKDVPEVELNLVSAGLQLLQRIDDWDIHQLAIVGREAVALSSSTIPTDGSTCPICQKALVATNSSTSKTTRRGLKTASLSDLHDEEIESPFPGTTSFAPSSVGSSRFFRHRPERTLSLKDVLKASSSGSSRRQHGNASTDVCTCAVKPRPSQPTKASALATDWSTVRSRAYKKFLSHLQQQQQLRGQYGRPLLTEATSVRTPRAHGAHCPPFQLDETYVLHHAVANPRSPTWRACLMLLAHSQGGPKSALCYQKIARLCWRGYERGGGRRPDKEMWLRVYSEWLGECSFFDHRERAWDALRPLVRHVTEATTSPPPRRDDDVTTGEGLLDDDDDDDEERKEADTSTMTEAALSAPLACLGFILMRRSRLFQSTGDISDDDKDDGPTSVRDEFHALTVHLSIHHGDAAGPWLKLYSDEDDETHSLVWSELQRLGILGLSDDVDVRDATSSPGESSSSSSSSSAAGTTSTDSWTATVVPGDELATRDWPFAAPFSARRAVERIDPTVLTLDRNRGAAAILLSSPFDDDDSKKHGRSCSKAKSGVRRARPVVAVAAVPILDHLFSSDVFNLIFSFCGFRRLAKIRQVCKTWRAAVDDSADELWRGAYLARFGAFRVDADPNADAGTTNRCPSALPMRWLELFRRRHVVERSIRHRRHGKTGYRYRTCPHLGCLHVMKSAAGERRHEEAHRRRCWQVRMRRMPRAPSAAKGKETKSGPASRGTKRKRKEGPA